MDFEAAYLYVTGSMDAREVFPAGLDEARKKYRALARILHPDVAGVVDQSRAVDGAAALNRLWDAYKKGVSGAFEITTKRRTYSVEPLLIRDGISNLYPVSWSDGEDQYGYLRLPRSPKNNDLVAAEASSLRKLDAGDPDYARYRVYAPTLIEAFRHRDAKSKVDRWATVTSRLGGFMTLAEVRDYFPDGMDGRDVAWIWRRLLTAVGWTHQLGMVNGAILPHNVLIHPTLHGVILANWCYSVEAGQPLVAVDKQYRGWYPQSAFEKKHVDSRLDTVLLTKTIGFLFGTQTPKKFAAFMKGCSLDWGAMPEPWALLSELDDLLHQMYGKRRYRPLVLPATS